MIINHVPFQHQVCDFIGQCPSASDELRCPLHYDFESGMLGWEEVKEDNLNWIWATGMMLVLQFMCLYRSLANKALKQMVLHSCVHVGPVSYTHLTLPTKRIV